MLTASIFALQVLTYSVILLIDPKFPNRSIVPALPGLPRSSGPRDGRCGMTTAALPPGAAPCPSIEAFVFAWLGSIRPTRRSLFACVPVPPRAPPAMRSVRRGCTMAIAFRWSGSRSRRVSTSPRLPAERKHRPSPAGWCGELRQTGREKDLQRLQTVRWFRHSQASSRTPLRSLSLRDDASLGNVLVEIVIEVVASGAERGQTYGDRLTGLDGLFAVELEALELDRLYA